MITIDKIIPVHEILNKAEGEIQTLLRMPIKLTMHVEYHLQVNHLLSIVSDELSISADDILSTNRRREVTEARYIAMDLVREFTQPNSLTGIGILFNRDHSSIHYALTQSNALRKVDRYYQKKYNQCLDRIKKEASK